MWGEVLSQEEHWNFILSQPARSGLFLQTPAWLQFQEYSGNKARVLAYRLNNQVTGLCLLVRSGLPAGFHYWFAPKGPIFNSELGTDEQNKALRSLSDYLKQDRSLFLRLEPRFKLEKIKKVKDVNPRATAIVDLARDFSEVLSGMHEKTRYNMRLAERKGLKFRWGGAGDFKNFWQLLQATAGREGFSTHQSRHYEGMLELFGQEPLTTDKIACRLALVEHQNKLLAASLVVADNKQVTYLHGASSRDHKELMAPYLLHGLTMRLVQEAGCLSYDMWGVQPRDGSLSSWSGFSRFKMGWGGTYFEEPGTFDEIFRSLPYVMYKIARRFRF